MTNNDAIAKAMPEKELQANVIKWAKLHGWKVYHTHDSRRSEPGFPDLLMIRNDQALAIELKSQKGKLTEAQIDWLTAFASIAGFQAMILRPSDWLNGTIEEMLK